MQELIISWIKSLNRENLSPHTTKAYHDDVCNFVKFIINYLGKNIDLTEYSNISISTIRAWLTHLNDNQQSVASRKRALAGVKNFTKYLQQQHNIKDHAIFEMQGPKQNKNLPRPITYDQICEVLARLSINSTTNWINKRDEALVYLIYGLGLRIDEALSIKFIDWQLALKFITIIGKGNKARQVPLLDLIKEQVNIYLKLCPHIIHNNDYIFRGERGKNLQPAIVQRLMKKMRIELGLPDNFTPHSLRHSCASHLINESNDLRSIQELLGHVSLSSTQIYTEILNKKLNLIHKNLHPRNKV